MTMTAREFKDAIKPLIKQYMDSLVPPDRHVDGLDSRVKRQLTCANNEVYAVVYTQNRAERDRIREIYQ